jgi:ribosomal protein S18 acetylase RimI-like enzyme
MTSCSLCDEKPQYRDRLTGKFVCLEHARLEVVAAGQHSSAPSLEIRRASASDYARIHELSLYFWDETLVDCHDRLYDVLACPAFLACEGEEVMGLAIYALEPEWDAIVLVIFNVLPDFQGRGGGRALLDAVCNEALRRGLGRVIVATSNDDLPALALYQRYGFRITEVILGRIAQHHGGELPGFAGIPIRDEIRLTYEL